MKRDFKIGDKIKLIVNVGPLKSDGHEKGVQKGDTLVCVDKHEPLEGYHLGNGEVSVKWANNYKSYFEEKEMTFTKDMFKTGMRVVHNNGEVAIVLKDIGVLALKDGFNYLENLDHNLTYDGPECEWTVKVVYEGYTANSNVLDFNELGKLLWKRGTQTPEQKQLQEVMTKISELQKQAEKLQLLVNK